METTDVTVTVGLFDHPWDRVIGLTLFLNTRSAMARQIILLIELHRRFG